MSSGGRRSRTTQQSYQDKQTFPIEKGVSYDCTLESGSYKLTPQFIRIVLDNRGNNTHFCLMVGTTPIVVPLGKTHIIGEVRGVLTIRFARSDNPNDIAEIDFVQTCTVKPAIFPADGKWPLFSAEL